MALDGLRGVAALIVLAYHADYFLAHEHVIHHGYLAVDFFFALSGFVLAASYEPRFESGELGFARFMVAVRGVRLWPLVLLGALTGFAVYKLGPNHSSYTIKMLVEQIIFWPWRWAGMGVYPLNNTQWSLGFELIANIAHIIVLRRLGSKALATLAAISGVALTYACFHYGSLDIGNSFSTFFGGLARVSFSYTMGILLYRLYKSGMIKEVRNGIWGALALLVSITCFPTASQSQAGHLTDLIGVFVVFPAIICISLAPIGMSLVNRWAERTGAISYPAYILQNAPLQALSNLFGTKGRAVRWTIAALSVPAISLYSWAALKLYDEPVRKALGKQMRTSRRAAGFTAP